ncbi:MAG TPA: polymer-forming cytoskeletal protein [Longimicrobium sp.]|jgi:cytoskeletal protein CcmA (bactofilin family)
MAIFSGGKKNGGGAAAREKAPPAPRGGNPDSMSIIGPGMHIVGDLVTDGTVRVEGRVDGTLRAGKAVVVGKEGEVRGDIITQDAVIGGRVRGTVTAESRLELQATCDIEGQVSARASHLHLEEGARFTGQVQMLGEDAPRALPAPAPSGENSPEYV